MLAELWAGLWGSIPGSVRGFRPHNVQSCHWAQPASCSVGTWVITQGVMCVTICGQRLAAAVRTSEHGVRTVLF